MADYEDPKKTVNTSFLFEEYLSNFLTLIKFAKWDNLCGPKVIKVWRSESSESVQDSDSLVYISNHILNGEVWRLTDKDWIELKFYIFPKFNLLTLSAIFLNTSDVYSISFLFPFSQLSLYTRLHSTFCDIIKEKFSTTTEDKVTGIDQLLHDIVPEFLRIRFQSIPLNLEDILLNRKLTSDKFLHNCCSSHLLTGGRTVVCGSNTRHVRSMLHTLSYFMLDEDRPLTHLYSGEDFAYKPYYYLQGFSNADTGREQIIRYSKERVTIIDLDNICVHLFQASRIGKNGKVPAEAFIKTRTRAKLIKDFFLDFDLLPNIAAVRELYIRDFLRLLMKKAFALVCFEDIIRELEFPGDHDPGLLFSQLKQDLLLEREEDLGIVLSFAHRLSPTRTKKMLQDFIMISASQVEIKSIL